MNTMLMCLELLLIATCSMAERKPKMLVILADGARWDYPNEGDFPGLKMMEENGVKAEYCIPIMPSNSYPNWMSLMTGLYAESHGFVENQMYDSYHDDFFLMGPEVNTSHEHWWNQAEPLWITAKKKGYKVAMYWWNGCQVEIQRRTPDFCLEYNGLVPENETRMALISALDQLEKEDYQLAMVYYEIVDEQTHIYGPESNERKLAFKRFDESLYEIMKLANERRMDNLHVVLLSDHGMADVTNFTVINITSAIDLDDVNIQVYAGAGCGLLPNPGKERKLYEDLKKANFDGLSVFRKDEIPESFHIRNNDHTLPIVLIADPGFMITRLPYPEKSTFDKNINLKGFHGWDPYKEENMRALFYASGPELTNGFVSRPIQNVDQYNLMCSLLGLEPKPNNGSLTRIDGMLIPIQHLVQRSCSTSLHLSLILLIITMLITMSI